MTLLALNLQNSFLSEKGSLYMGEKAETLKIRVMDFLSKFSGKKIFVREIHGKEDTIFMSEKTHSIANSYDCEIHENLRKFADLKDDKTYYDALYNTEIETLIKKQNTKDITVIGLETHTSVMFTVNSLCNRGYNVSVIEPCVMSREDYLHGCAITIMRHYLNVRING
ncbi:hypothetical protein DRQ07_03100 [candidate division KSB1 bacterium]|nr:MAG: hypothetical protein DRQ07_03100 [candidate division KSB1 bacterium]